MVIQQTGKRTRTIWMKIKFIIGSYTGGETRSYDHVYGLDYRTIYLNFMKIVGQNSLYRILLDCGLSVPQSNRMSIIG